MKKTTLLLLAPMVLMPALLAGCNATGGSTGSATMSLGVADTPVDGATSVEVTFTGVELQGPSGTKTFNFTSPKAIDLIATQGGNAASLLAGETVPAGGYQWIRLLIDPTRSSITLSDGSVHALTIPSGSQSGLKLVSGFTMAAGSQADFTIDFDLRKAVTLANGTYILKPALRLMNNQQVGSIAGSAPNTFTIGGTSITSMSCSPAVYVYTGTNVTPVDLNDSAQVQPVTTATLQLNNTTGNYDYTASYLAPGSYTLAVTCAANDNPTQADTLTFSTAVNASVTGGQTTTADFQ